MTRASHKAEHCSVEMIFVLKWRINWAVAIYTMSVLGVEPQICGLNYQFEVEAIFAQM